MYQIIFAINTNCTILMVSMFFLSANIANLPSHQADTAGSDSPFGATAAMKFKTPALLLEDIEHHIKAIDCLGSRVYLYFSSSKALKNFKAWTAFFSLLRMKAATRMPSVTRTCQYLHDVIENGC